MTDQDELARRIAKLLDESADGLAPAQRERLNAARQRALSHYRTEPVRGWIPVWAGINGITERAVFGVRYLIPMAALVLGLMGVMYMHTNGAPDIADIDAGLLTDELPLDAFLDTSLDAWLKRSPR
jgi:hypothetical protein